MEERESNIRAMVVCGDLATGMVSEQRLLAIVREQGGEGGDRGDGAWRFGGGAGLLVTEWCGTKREKV